MKSVFDSRAEFFERFLVEAIEDAVVVTRPDGTIVFWNPAAEALYGWGPEEVVGRLITEITVQNDSLLEAEAILALLQSGESWAGDFVVKRRDGSTFTAQVRHSPVRDSAGELVGILGISHDVTRQRGWEADLQAREAALRHELDEARALTQLLETREHAWQFLSEASRVLSESLDVQNSVGRIPQLAIQTFSDWCALHLLDDDGSIRRVAVAHRDEGRQALADEFLQVGADLRPVEAVIRNQKAILVPSITAAGLSRSGIMQDRANLIAALGLGSSIMVPLVGRERCVGCVSFVRDAASLAFGEEDLWIAKEFGLRAGLAIENANLFDRLRTTARVKDEILGLISHEFRTPLTTILGGVGILARHGEGLDATTRGEVVEGMQRDGERLERVIENMLTLARGEHAATVEAEPLLLQRLIPALLERMKLHEPGRATIARLPSKLPMVKGVPSMVEQVVGNLVTNAWKYGIAGTPVTVAAEVRPELGMVVIEVSDEGAELAQEEIDRFFEPFYRGSGSREGSAGAGLGMAVCSTLVRSLGGQIWARPREGGGLVVSFSLPSLPASSGDEDEPST
ncbi:MAG: sensor histidine kinase [Tepidiformaceae bacterium]